MIQLLLKHLVTHLYHQKCMPPKFLFLLLDSSSNHFQKLKRMVFAIQNHQLIQFQLSFLKFGVTMQLCTAGRFISFSFSMSLTLSGCSAMYLRNSHHCVHSCLDDGFPTIAYQDFFSLPLIIMQSPILYASMCIIPKSRQWLRIGFASLLDGSTCRYFI